LIFLIYLCKSTFIKIIFYLVPQINKTIRGRFTIKFISQDVYNPNVNEMFLESDDNQFNNIMSFYLFENKKMGTNLFIEHEINQELNIVLLSYDETLNFYSFLIEKTPNNLNIKERIQFNKYQNNKLVLQLKFFFFIGF